MCGTGAHLRYLDVHLVFDLVVQHLGRRGGSGRHRRRRHRLTQLVRLRAGAAARGKSAPQVGSPLLERVGERAQQRTLLAILALRGRPGSTSPRALVSSKGSATLNSNTRWAIFLQRPTEQLAHLNGASPTLASCIPSCSVSGKVRMKPKSPQSCDKTPEAALYSNAQRYQVKQVLDVAMRRHSEEVLNYKCKWGRRRLWKVRHLLQARVV